MEIGMLWFDDDPKLDLIGKVSRAASYYLQRYGEEPNLCFVHPSMIPLPTAKTGQVTIQPNTTVLPHHFWIGVNQDEPALKA